MLGVELFFFYLFAVAANLSIAALNAALGGLTLFFLWRLVRLEWRPSLPEWLLIAYLAWNAVSALFSPMRYEAFVGVLNHWSWCPLLVATAMPWGVRKNLERFTTFLSVSALLTIPISLCAFFLATDFHKNVLYRHVPVGTVNATGYFSHHLTYAGVVTAAGLFIAARALYGGGKGRLFCWVSSAACGLGLLLTLARTYVLAAIPGVLVLVWKKGKKWAAAALVAAAVLFALAFALGPASVRLRISSMWDLNNASNAERIYLWVSGIDMWKERPVLGWGPGIYDKTAGPFKEPYQGKVHYPDHEGFRTTEHCHSLYVMTAVQSGIVGLLLFFAFVVAAFRQMARQEDLCLRYGAMAAFTAFLVGGLFEFNAGDAEVATLVFFFVGLALARGEDRAQEPESP